MIIRAKSKKRLGDILIEEGLLTEEQLVEILAKQKGTNKLLGEFIVESGYLERDQIAFALQKQLDIEQVQTVIQSNVMRSYKVASKQKKEYDVLPENVKKFTLELSNKKDLKLLS